MSIHNHCVAGGKDSVPLAQQRLAEFLCDEVRRGKACPFHEKKAEAYYQVLLRAQAEDREKSALAALDRLAGLKPGDLSVLGADVRS